MDRHSDPHIDAWQEELGLVKLPRLVISLFFSTCGTVAENTGLSLHWHHQICRGSTKATMEVSDPK